MCFRNDWSLKLEKFEFYRHIFEGKIRSISLEITNNSIEITNNFIEITNNFIFPFLYAHSHSYSAGLPMEIAMINFLSGTIGHCTDG